MTTCQLNETQNYIETATFRPIEALPNHFEFLIQSQLLDAKDPSALNVKYKTIVSENSIIQLRNSLNKILGG